ncbi:MAG: ABC transporter permease [Chloroflexi bacterium]|nr:ABC transporter permease [Chloroflexota bacterium]
MRNILTISKRELMRLRARFGGRSRVGFIVFLLIAAAMSVMTFRRAPVVGETIYRIGVSVDAPRPTDGRFNVVVADPATGRALLESKAIDAYIDGTKVVTRGDNKSRYAAGALRRVLENLELSRINSEFDLAHAFPLRIEVDYLDLSTAPSAVTSTEPLITLPAASSPSSTEAPANTTDSAVLEQIRESTSGSLPQLKSTADKEIIVPSLTAPPNPFGQVILTFLYILPVFFVSVFFTSGFMDEKTNRKLTILLSAPITPFQIIVGKMLPYVTFSLVGVVVMALVTQVSPLLALAIFTPAVLFIFGIYLIVPMLYRTFKDTTFISMLATAMTTAYLIFPAMFSGLSDIAFMSPVTLAVKMYRGESFGLQEYLFATTPLALIFGLSLYVGTRVLNEEFLMGYRPLSRKIADSIYLIVNREHISISIFVLSLLLIPIVYIAQLVALAIALNLPLQFAVAGMLVIASIIEEIAKSVGIVVLNEHGYIRSTRQTFWLSLLSAIGFLTGEKALLFLSLGIVSQSAVASALFNAGLLPVTLAVHFAFTSIVAVLTVRFRVRYTYALILAAAIHSLYNWLLVGGIG